jgi:MoxR-like ATPase
MPFLSSAALEALLVPGIAERWAAVQAHLHPLLAELAEKLQPAAQARLPRRWPLYETSYKSHRSINRGRGQRLPIADYYVAFDRPPRGAGVLITVSGTEQAVLVGIQLWGARKPQLHQLWEGGRNVWLPLIERIAEYGQLRFAGFAAESDTLWIEQYLAGRQAQYLWAGFVYPWAELPEDLDRQLIDATLQLLPLNEALMELAEAPEPGLTTLREQRVAYSAGGDLPPIELISERIRRRGFAISDTIIRAYHLALQTRPFVIVPGISGTGKTRLSRLYADAVCNIDFDQQPNPQYLLVAVQPDWHNARDLLGYYNALNDRFHPTPFLQFLLRAAADPQQLYFACLDEMNLARPEYYLAPLLSAMETGERLIELGAPGNIVTTPTGELIANPLRLPLNLRLIGTVNVDESTFMLSDKLLDRAAVIELTDVDLAAFRAAYTEPVDAASWQIITAIHGIVARAGQPFGYRVIADMLRYVEQAQGLLAPEQALDLQIKQRVLPKLRGEDNPRLRRALSELLGLLLGEDGPPVERAAQLAVERIAAAPYPESAEKVRRMLERLDLDGFTDFYG